MSSIRRDVLRSTGKNTQENQSHNVQGLFKVKLSWAEFRLVFIFELLRRPNFCLRGCRAEEMGRDVEHEDIKEKKAHRQ